MDPSTGELILAAIIGWCGTYWPRRFPLPVPPGPYPNPDDPWPPNCPVCGAIIGAIAAVVLWLVLGDQFGDTVLDVAVVSFFGGAFGATLVGGLMSFGRRRTVVNR